jgi:hypothetical protein
MSTLPPFPLDDSTLLAIEHALGASLTYERPDHALSDSNDEGPWLTGADYSLGTLLDFLAGATGRDPNEVLIRTGDPERPGWDGAEIVEDTRPHYSEHDLIAALIAEVRRLREVTR